MDNFTLFLLGLLVFAIVMNIIAWVDNRRHHRKADMWR